MYRELLQEFEEFSKTASDDNLEKYAAGLLVELEKAGMLGPVVQHMLKSQVGMGLSPLNLAMEGSQVISKRKPLASSLIDSFVPLAAPIKNTFNNIRSAIQPIRRQPAMGSPEGFMTPRNTV